MARYDIGQENKELLKILELQSKGNQSSLHYKSMLETIMCYIITQYESSSKIKIPLIGEFDIERKGAKIEGGKRIPVYDIKLTFDPLLLHDLIVVENQKNDIYGEEMYIDQMLKEKIENTLLEKM